MVKISCGVRKLFTPTACQNFSKVTEESTKFDVMNREGQ